MASDRSDLVRGAVGELVPIELYQRALTEAGIDSQVVGGNLEAGPGTALPGAIELWVRRAEVAQAAAAIVRAEAKRARPPHDRPPHGRPDDDPKPGRPVTHGPHPHNNPDPRS
jgi:hypothetical protein